MKLRSPCARINYLLVTDGVMDVKKFLIFCLLPLFLVGCKPGGEKATQLAQAAVANDMNDPETTKFRNVHYVQEEEKPDGTVRGAVCGEINSRNMFGAYDGYQPFLVVLEMKSKGTFSKGVSYTVPFKHVFADIAAARQTKIYRDRCDSQK